MRLVALVWVVLFGCGSVKETTNDGGNDASADAPSCGGTVDMNGNCICPARFAAPACTSCAPGWSGPSCTEFSDNFNRGAGALGGNYAALTVLLADDALIFNNRACGDVQSVGVLNELVDSPRLSAQVSFDPGNIDGQEFGFLISSEVEIMSVGSLYLAGCEGGGGLCNMRIGQVNGAPLAQREIMQPIPNGALSRTTLDIDGSNNITIGVTVGGSVEQLSAQLPTGFIIQRFGFIVGRNPDGVLSCIDDLSFQIK